MRKNIKKTNEIINQKIIILTFEAIEIFKLLYEKLEIED